MTTATIHANERINRRFELYDVDGNGTVERADLEAEARRIIQAFGESETSPKGRAAKDAYLGMWNHLAEKTGVGPNGSVNLEQFTRFVQQHVLGSGGAGYTKVLRPTIAAMVDLADTDGDRKVSPSEFKRWLDAIGVDRSSADEAFKKMDTDRDGFLDTEELINAVREYHEGRLDVPLLGR